MFLVMNVKGFKGKVRGVHLTRVIKYVKKKRGVLGLKEFLQKIHEKTGNDKIGEDYFEEKGWYSYDLYLDFLEIADDLFGTGDGMFAYNAGLATIKDMGILSYITRKPDIQNFIKNAEKNFDQVYDFGSFEWEEPREGVIYIRYHGFPNRNVRCKYFLGSIQGMLDLCKLDNGKVEETKCSTPEGYCEYKITWNPR